MAETKREIERKYEATGDDVRLPDLTKAAGVASVVDKGVAELDAVYYDTQDLRLAADSLTLRRRTGGDDAGWHLKFPVATGIRDEIRAPCPRTSPAPWPHSCAPASATPDWPPSYGCSPPATYAICSTRTACCSPR